MRMRYNPPPGWPRQSPGFTPPRGWSPDPSWGPSPEGWQIWIVEPERRHLPKPVLAALVGLAVIGGAWALGSGLYTWSRTPRSVVTAVPTPVVQPSVRPYDDPVGQTLSDARASIVAAGYGVAVERIDEVAWVGGDETAWIVVNADGRQWGADEPAPSIVLQVTAAG